MAAKFRLTVNYGDRPWETVGELTIEDERLLAMLADRNVRLELSRDIKDLPEDPVDAVLGVSLVPMQLEAPSKKVCGDIYRHEDGHVYYCGMKPRHGGLHDSVVDTYDLYEGKSVTWLDASKRVEPSE